MPVRIYDIAKKLGLESKEIISKAKALGMTAAKVPSSSLDKITAEYLEGEILKQHPELAKAAPTEAAPAAPPAPPPPPEQPKIIVAPVEVPAAPAPAPAVEAPAAETPAPPAAEAPAPEIGRAHV